MAVDLTLLPNVSLAEQSTFKIGGPALWFARVGEVAQLEAAVSLASDRHIPVLFIGEGSNILFPDSGFPGLVVKNRFLGFVRSGDEVEIGAAENLGETIRRANGLGLAGLECMYGIPGSVAGALVGNAGAYGQEIGSVVVSLSVWSASRGVQVIDARGAGFRYRHSVLKCHRELFVTGCRLRLRPGIGGLQAVSDEILSRRLVKYPVGLRCPGSFFKNVLVTDLPEDQLARVPAEFIQFGKIPAGRLLEEVGARGATRGDAIIADYHANLVLNRGRATSRDVVALTSEYAERVFDRFGIRLEPEILILEQNSVETK